MRILFLALLAGVTLYSCEPKGGEMTSEMGTRYTLFKTGSGEIVQEGEYVSFHANMRTEGDSVLFSTRETGGELPIIQAAAMDVEDIGPVEDVLRYMRLGDSAVVRVNIEGNPQRPPGLEMDSVIIYDVVVQEILTEEAFNMRREEKMAEMDAERALVTGREEERLEFAEGIRASYKAGDIGEVQSTPSGLKYVIHEEGTGPQAKAGDQVTVQYIGKLVEDGSVFDQSFERGSGIPFRLGARQVIPGWDEGIALLKEGAKATFFIPADLAYGAQGTPDGSIPGGSELSFYVELEKVN